MDIALFNEKITFQKSTVTIDKIGNHVSEWTDYFSCWATAGGESGTERQAAGTTVEDFDVTFTVRYCSKAAAMNTTEYRVVFHDELYNITSIDHQNYKKKSLKFRCQKVSR